MALSNQHTAILLETPIVLWVVYKSDLLHHKELLLKTSLCFLTGLVPYCTVPIFASFYPHQGSWGDVTSLRGFIHHLLRRDYGTFQLYSGDSSEAESMLERSLHWLVNLGSEQSANNPMISAVFLSSMLLQARETIGIRRVIVGSLMFYVVVFHSLANLPLSNPLHFAIHSRFWMHPNLLAFVAIGIGMSKLCSTYVRRSKKRAQCLTVMMALMPMHSAKRGFKYSDESSNVYFDNYARSVLEPLPRDSLLLINWDQQWTSIRYLQECEGFRDDITSINLSMMSYPWFESKHPLYEGITFPGTHYTPSRGSGFTFSQFVANNYGAFAKRIFVGGGLSYPDATFDQAYDLLPFGMVNQVVANDADGPDFEDYQHHTKEAWKQVVRNYHASGLPDAKRYTERTWEHTIGRMVYDSLYSRATTLLDMSIKNEGSDRRTLPSIVEATAWLELLASHDEELASSPSLKKNLGLAYMKIVQSKELNSSSPLPVVEDIFDGTGNTPFMHPLKKYWWTEESGIDCKAWASERWKVVWGEFLDMDGAKTLPDYGQIKAIYQITERVAQAKL